MTLRILADATVVLHFGFVLFVVLGGLLLVRWPRLAWLHVPAAAWGAWVEFAGQECPLTPLENWLRRLGGGSAYTASFVDHYVGGILYPSFLSRELQFVLGGLVLLVNAAVYGSLVARRVRGRRVARSDRGAANRRRRQLR